ncbi:unnamed protein product, partial [Didymodactylos carnosus]
MKCSDCGRSGDYTFKVTKRLGLSYYVSFTCECGDVLRFVTGTRIRTDTSTQMTDLNMTSIIGGSLVGLHRRGLTKLFGTMGILPPVQIESYKKYEKFLCDTAEHVVTKSMQDGAQEACTHFQSKDICVSVDGTWLTQGFSSLHGIGTCCSAADPPKVLDHQLLSRHCSKCAGLVGVKTSDGELYDKLLTEHLKRGCEANYQGSSGGMEGTAVVQILKRSIQKHGLQYTSFIADGDTKNDVSVSETEPYGPGIIIERKHCINHYSKRMKTRLSTIKKQHGSNRLPDRKTIGGKGRLDDSKIYRAQVYFGNAVRENVQDLKSMQVASWSAWYHFASSDKHPNHDFCNPDRCGLYLDYNYQHQEHSLPPRICEAIHPA